jgi:ubiquinone/menaquinone biosynthesis C-methylase UbiE
MAKLTFPDQLFDFCISDQVLEHIDADPFEAIRESVRVLKKGGYVVHTTCFINPIHGVPNDYWRFTPNALELILKKLQCEVIEAGGWGNRETWTYIDLGFRACGIPDNPKNPIHKLAMHNEPDVPIVTWIAARKL